MNSDTYDKAPAFKRKSKKPDDTAKSGQKKREFKPPKKISEKYLHNSGLAYLQKFTASSMHFKTVMKRKIDKSCRHHLDQEREECLTMLDNVTEKFIEMGLLDDEGYLKGMIISFRRRGLSTRQIEAKLRQKGYESERIITALRQHDLTEYDTEYKGDLYAAITFARKKKIGPYDKIGKYEFDKALGVMGRAGYNFEISRKIIEMKEDELEEFRDYI